MSRRGISEESFEVKRKHAVQAARELCYGKEYILRLKGCKNESELYRTMKTARQKKFEI